MVRDPFRVKFECDLSTLKKRVDLIAWIISPFVPIHLKPKYGEIYKTFLCVPAFDGSYGSVDCVIGWIR